MVGLQWKPMKVTPVHGLNYKKDSGSSMEWAGFPSVALVVSNSISFSGLLLSSGGDGTLKVLSLQGDIRGALPVSSGRKSGGIKVVHLPRKEEVDAIDCWTSMEDPELKNSSIQTMLGALGHQFERTHPLSALTHLSAAVSGFQKDGVQKSHHHQPAISPEVSSSRCLPPNSPEFVSFRESLFQQLKRSGGASDSLVEPRDRGALEGDMNPISILSQLDAIDAAGDDHKRGGSSSLSAIVQMPSSQSAASKRQAWIEKLAAGAAERNALGFDQLNLLTHQGPEEEERDDDAEKGSNSVLESSNQATATLSASELAVEKVRALAYSGSLRPEVVEARIGGVKTINPMASSRLLNNLEREKRDFPSFFAEMSEALSDVKTLATDTGPSKQPKMSKFLAANLTKLDKPTPPQKGRAQVSDLSPISLRGSPRSVAHSSGITKTAIDPFPPGSSFTSKTPPLNLQKCSANSSHSPGITTTQAPNLVVSSQPQKKLSTLKISSKTHSSAIPPPSSSVLPDPLRMLLEGDVHAVVSSSTIDKSASGGPRTRVFEQGASPLDIARRRLLDASVPLDVLGDSPAGPTVSTTTTTKTVHPVNRKVSSSSATLVINASLRHSRNLERDENNDSASHSSSRPSSPSLSIISQGRHVFNLSRFENRDVLTAEEYKYFYHQDSVVGVPKVDLANLLLALHSVDENKDGRLDMQEWINFSSKVQSKKIKTKEELMRLMYDSEFAHKLFLYSANSPRVLPPTTYFLTPVPLYFSR